ncbi:MAG: Ig-like domain-containing protein [Bacteroidales bacterium]|nr:Ig-like domain-containing protein [Bacteroidales bacterium]
MKSTKYYLSILALAAAGFASCSDDAEEIVVDTKNVVVTASDDVHIQGVKTVIYSEDKKSVDLSLTYWGKEIWKNDDSHEILYFAEDGAEVKFTSADTTIAKVDNKGVITPVAKGSTKVTFEAGKLKKEIAVNVTSSTVEESYLSSVLINGKRYKFKCANFFNIYEDASLDDIDIYFEESDNDGYFEMYFPGEGDGTKYDGVSDSRYRFRYNDDIYELDSRSEEPKGYYLVKATENENVYYVECDYSLNGNTFKFAGLVKKLIK